MIVRTQSLWYWLSRGDVVEENVVATLFKRVYNDLERKDLGVKVWAKEC